MPQIDGSERIPNQDIGNESVRIGRVKKFFHHIGHVISDWRYPAALAGLLLVISVVLAQLITIPGQKAAEKRSEQANAQRLCIAVETGKVLFDLSVLINAEIIKDTNSVVELNNILQAQAARLSEGVLEKICPGPTK